MKYIILLLLCTSCASAQKKVPPIVFGFGTIKESVSMIAWGSHETRITDSVGVIATKKDSVWNVIDTLRTINFLLGMTDQFNKDSDRYIKEVSEYEDFRKWLLSLPCGEFLMKQYRNRNQEYKQGIPKFRTQ